MLGLSGTNEEALPASDGSSYRTLKTPLADRVVCVDTPVARVEPEVRVVPEDPDEASDASDLA